MQAIPHFTFTGNCKEAMRFYQKCFGGTLQYQTIGESPLSKRMPVKMRKCIVHASLKNDNFCLYASDLITDEGLKKGNQVAISVVFNSIVQLNLTYKKLSGKSIKNNIIVSYSKNYTSSLVDKFGNSWVLVYHHEN